MESRQGKALSPERITKIKTLLAKTDLSLNEIAVRMGCSSGRVGHINRQFGIRHFGKKRSTWLVVG